MADNKKIIWDFFMKNIGNAYGVAGLMGNLKAESNFSSTNLQQTYERKLGMTDAQYTKAVDNGTYTNFVKDAAGYGLAQWTYWSRKQALKNYADSKGKSIGDLQMQLEYLYKELKGYPQVISVLKSAKTLKEASDVVMLQFERPADQSSAARSQRASYGEAIYNEYGLPKKYVKVDVLVLRKGCIGDEVKALQILLNGLGFDCGKADGEFGGNTEKAVIAFQKKNGLGADGIAGKDTWNKILN